MCIICARIDMNPWDSLHIEEAAKSKSQEYLTSKKASVRDEIKKLEVWVLSQHISGFEKLQVEETLENLKLVEKILHRST